MPIPPTLAFALHAPALIDYWVDWPPRADTFPWPPQFTWYRLPPLDFGEYGDGELPWWYWLPEWEWPPWVPRSQPPQQLTGDFPWPPPYDMDIPAPLDPWPPQETAPWPPGAPGIPAEWYRFSEELLTLWRQLSLLRVNSGLALMWPIWDAMFYFDVEATRAAVDAFVWAWNSMGDSALEIKVIYSPGPLANDAPGITAYRAWLKTLKLSLLPSVITPDVPMLVPYRISVLYDGAEVLSGDVTDPADQLNQPLLLVQSFDGAVWTTLATSVWTYTFTITAAFVGGLSPTMEVSWTCGNEDGPVAPTIVLIATDASTLTLAYAIDTYVNPLPTIDIARTAGDHTLTVTASAI
ncbi:MAG: hypothetical protein WC700_14315 [Gemmatimonadaceae bacterium]|jgi:hypothetical protein